jgi:hypothetical protein
LKRASNSETTNRFGWATGDQTTFKANCTGRRLKGSRYKVEARCLASSIWSDKGSDSAASQVEAYIVDRKQPAKTLRNIGNFEKASHGLTSFA